MRTAWASVCETTRCAGVHQPLATRQRTCEIAGYRAVAVVDADLVEWDYGDYEGKKTIDIRKERPGWVLFRDGCPNGESVAEIAPCADRVIARLRAFDRDVLLFSSGHFLRVLAARWLGLEAAAGRLFYLSTATVSILGYEHTRNEPVLQLWNDARHVGDCGARPFVWRTRSCSFRR